MKTSSLHWSGTTEPRRSQDSGESLSIINHEKDSHSRSFGVLVDVCTPPEAEPAAVRESVSPEFFNRELNNDSCFS